MQNSFTTDQIIKYTNERLKNWYKNIKIDYNIEGSGTLELVGKKDFGITEFIFKYEEDGEKKEYASFHYEGEGIDSIFEIWAEQAE